jgi:hypothetical protein
MLASFAFSQVVVNLFVVVASDISSASSTTAQVCVFIDDTPLDIIISPLPNIVSQLIVLMLVADTSVSCLASIADCVAVDIGKLENVACFVDAH